MIFLKNCKHLSQRLLLAKYQFSESERKVVSDCERCYLFHVLRENRERSKQRQSSLDSFIHWAHDTALIG